jgi:hypothetical protein
MIDDHYSEYCNFIDDVSTKRNVNYKVMESILLPYIKQLKPPEGESQSIKLNEESEEK